MGSDKTMGRTAQPVYGTDKTKDLIDAFSLSSGTALEADVSRLLEEGSNPKAKDLVGRTPLALAIKARSLDCVGALLPSSDVCAKDASGSSPIHGAAVGGRGRAQGGRRRMRKRATGSPLKTGWIDEEGHKGRTTLMWTGWFGNTDAIVELLARGSDPKRRTPDGLDAMIIAARAPRRSPCAQILEPLCDASAALPGGGGLARACAADEWLPRLVLAARRLAGPPFGVSPSPLSKSAFYSFSSMPSRQAASGLTRRGFGARAGQELPARALDCPGRAALVGWMGARGDGPWEGR